MSTFGVSLAAPAEQAKDITGDLGNLASTRYLDFQELAKTNESYYFKPTKILVKAKTGTKVIIRGTLWGMPPGKPLYFEISECSPHNLSFRTIYKTGTENASRILILGITP